ncbi:MAG: VWA domain-containing protein, partial [Deltaproteobacteria bacterium]|nr:VWA domain-containing protein [Deltaproteobacteria bacterium]
MNSLRIHSLMVSNFIFILLLLATGSAFAQRQYEVKPRILIVFDTSGSMARTFSGSSNYGDGSHDNWDGSRECCPGVYNGGGELSRLYAAKNAMSQMLNASGEIEFGLAKFAQDYYSNQNNAVASSYYYGNQTAGDFDELRYHGFTSNYWAEFDGADDVYKWLAVGFGDYASSGGDLLYGRGANTENDRAEVLMWMDHHEYGNGTEQADLSLWDGPDGDGLEQELRADGNTPLGEVLRASRYYLEELRDPVTGKDDYRSCRKYIVVVLTDGAANGAISSTSEVSELYADGIETWVIGLAYSSSTLNTMATNGGMHYDPNNWGSAFTAYSESALATALFYIVSESLVFEECNYIDDDCDFEVDEGVGGQFCDVHNTYLDDATTLEWDTDSAPIWNESGDTDTFSNPNHDYVCDDPGETVCDGIDDNCDGQIDETPNDGAWSANEDPDFGTACTPPDDTDVPSYLSDDPDNIPSPCRAGTWVCIPGGEGKQCINYIGPTVEKCDGIDNDCDGLVDENTDNLADYSIVDTDVTCGSSVGACSEGYLECTAGGWACNDTDGSAEECDGIDNDCDGVTDETFTGQGNDCYEEGDGDATNGCILNVDVWECYGICEVGELICDDTDGTYGTACVGMSTPQPDNTCNGLDDDCDGSIDDDVATGTTACPAGSGAWTVKSVGNPYTLCVAGTLQCCGSDVTGCTMPDDAGDIVCVPNNSEPAIVSPTAEVCDGYDNDCDGEIDENLSTACGGCIDADYPSFDCIDTDPGRGECSVGLISCTASNGSGSASWSSCVGSRGPVEETCNGKDDDCDGAVDEDLNLGSCYPAGLSGCVDTDCVGECAVGTYVCSSGTLSCVGYTAPSLEGTVCDDLDNNCNGQVDEGITNTCGDSLDTETYPGAANGVGICRYGVQYCSEGVTANATDWGSCTGSQGPTAELCNGLDDDCDGAYEDSEAADLAANSEDSLVGASCGACDGVYECVPDTSKTVGQLGAYGLECVGEEPGVEVCNGEDENCNDILDDGIDPVSCGGCVVGVDTEFDCIDTDPSAGECEEGLNYCLDGGWTTDCYGAVGPVSEVCDGLDNDCDGNVDEDFIGMDDVVCQVAVGECPEGIQQCVAVDGVTSLHCCDANVWDASGECVTPEIAQIEECDGRDNDCDGFVDEDLAGTGEPCGQSLGICEPGTYQCILDTDAGDYGIVCIGGSGGTDEVCNNLDDDCDGQVDEDIP